MVEWGKRGEYPTSSDGEEGGVTERAHLRENFPELAAAPRSLFKTKITPIDMASAGSTSHDGEEGDATSASA